MGRGKTTGSKADGYAMTLRNRSEPPEGAAPSKHGVQFLVKGLNAVVPRPILSTGSSAHTGRPPHLGLLHSTRVGGFPRERWPLLCPRCVSPRRRARALCPPQARRVYPGVPSESPRFLFAMSTVHMRRHCISTGVR